MSLRAVPQWAYDAAVLAVAAVHLLVVIRIHNQPAAAFAIAGVAALVFRRRFPLPVFLVTLPAAAMVTEKVASLLAIYALAYRARTRWIPIAAIGLLTAAFCYSDPELWRYLAESPGSGSGPEFFLWMSRDEVAGVRRVLYYWAISTVPATLGYLMRTRRMLYDRIEEISEAREHEQRLLLQQALAADRAQLSREMHDVVSHQVSLIAVQAGALRMQAKDDRTREAASTIRRLSVRTLEELRHMVRVLRASGIRATELTPQPTIAEIESLVGGSGIEAGLVIEDLPELEPPGQRAVYRAVQEALTNVRKHAPGASARVRIGPVAEDVEVEVVNSAPTRPVVDLPSSRHGLMGLRQRAELLGGSLDYGPTGEGGWRLRLRLPAAVTSGDR
ncbi:sensor histidine kinase [Glycomyces xiaoerkulensis]|uniref:sensor histidine kinase n=1 Tax=Glycomyces xiaoerkulensis TaxID=2038139 RepID=UPI000C25BAF0|nr:histidine kinase [Glycomyces xiaoerkulensis]